MNATDVKKLPDGWTYTTIPETISYDGIFSDGDWVESKDQDPNGNVRLVQLADVGDGVYRNKSSRFLTKKKFKELNCTQILPNDILVARMPDPLGRACIFPGDKKDCITVVDVCIVRTGTNGPNHKWLMNTINSPYLRADIASLQSGSTRKRISRKNLAKIKFPLPPLGEQERIVGKIEELFSDLDAGVAALEVVKKEIKRYRQAVLKNAFEGKLTEKWRKENKDKIEPASKLLERIIKSRREKWEAFRLQQMSEQGKSPKNDRWKASYKEPAKPDDIELYKIPSSWSWTTLGQLTWLVKDGPHYSPKYSEEGIPFISGGNVRPNGVDFENAKYISPELHEELSKRCKPELNDILYTKGGTTGIARVNTYDIEFNVWVHVAVLKLTDHVYPFYLQNALNSPFCYSQSQKYTHGVGNQDLGLTRMVKIHLPIPPFEEQKEIFKEIERHFSIADKSEKIVEDALKQSQRLRQSILKRAFEGKLVPQDPNEEPAQKLLERIKKDNK